MCLKVSIFPPQFKCPSKPNQIKATLLISKSLYKYWMNAFPFSHTKLWLLLLLRPSHWTLPKTFPTRLVRFMSSSVPCSLARQLPFFVASNPNTTLPSNLFNSQIFLSFIDSEILFCSCHLYPFFGMGTNSFFFSFAPK